MDADFNPRPPRGGRPGYQYEDLRLVVISIHAPREGGDFDGHHHRPSVQQDFNPRPPRGGRRSATTGLNKRKNTFQSTPPARGATGYQYEDLRLVVISIHAPREGGDAITLSIVFLILGFQSTPPARGATNIKDCFRVINIISIHAPREGGDYL